MNTKQLVELNAPNNKWISSLIGTSDIAPNWNWLFPSRNEILFSFQTDSFTAIRDRISLHESTSVNELQKSAIRIALSYVTTITGIQFAEVSGSDADLFFSNTDIIDAKTNAITISKTYTQFAYSPDEISSLAIKQFVYFDYAEYSKDNLNPVVGSIGYETLLHEIGHTLGLKHPSDGSPNLSLIQDTTDLTLMSYTHFGIKDQFAPFDLAALMYLYGNDGVGGKYGYIENHRIIWGTPLSEPITGSNYDDILRGLAGDDTLDGGAGFDTGLWDSVVTNYELNSTNSGWKVVDKTGADGTDTLTNIEQLQFADSTVIIESKAHASYSDIPTELYQFFIAAFNAAPGVTYMDQLAEAYRYGLPIKQIVDIFTTKKQFTDAYSSSLSYADMATLLVNNIVKDSANSTAKTEAISDIKGALDNGWTVGDVIFAVFGNLARKSLIDPNWGNTVKQFNNEIAVAKYYTEVLNQSTTDLETLRDVIQPVTQSTDVSTDAVVAQLIGVALINSATNP
jgi:hypothetical protein